MPSTPRYQRKLLLVLAFASILTGVAYLIFRKGDEIAQRDPEVRGDSVNSSSLVSSAPRLGGGENRPEEPHTEFPGLKEIPSGDPRVRSFVDAEGRQAKMIRSDEKGRPIVEIDYKDGQELKVERLFSEEGKLLRVRHLRNDSLIKEETLR